MNKQFVDKNINIFRGKEAENKLLERNDKQYFEEEIGICKVSYDRWKEAQEYERKTWVEQCRNLSTDRNEDHAKHFENYKMLNDMLVNKELTITELGCGPFTNLRLILPTLKKQIKKVDLLDPLILDYINNMSRCPYKNCRLGLTPVNLIYSPIETFNTKEKYDLIVMINVLEHCFNFENIWEKIKSFMHEDSIFVFADKFIDDTKLTEHIDNQFDAGHPLRISNSFIDNKINKDYNILYKKSFVDEEEFKNQYLILKLK